MCRRNWEFVYKLGDKLAIFPSFFYIDNPDSLPRFVPRVQVQVGANGYNFGELSRDS
jgi:hypothetical protein